MKKRIVCALLTMILLLSLVPTTALTASAASLTTSEAAITVLKQLEGYSQTCDAHGYIGYGTLCTGEGTHSGAHKTNEKKADEHLRTELKDLDQAINSFASKNGLSLTQSKHDALVLFSFQNGTAWTTGTGEFKAAVTSGKRGSDFLNAICTWNASTSDDNRRMIEANMYLYGVYSSAKPSKFIRVYFFSDQVSYELPDGTDWQTYLGKINGTSNRCYYYDLTNKPAPHLVPTMDNHTFTGWYRGTELGFQKVSTLAASDNDNVLFAGWVPSYGSLSSAIPVAYIVNKSQLLSNYIYSYNETKGEFEIVKVVENKKKVNLTVQNYFLLDNAAVMDRDYLAENGTRWCRIKGTSYWVKVSRTGGSTGSNDNASIDLTVTVTNSYVNRRAKASIYSNKNGTYNAGDKLRIIDTASKDGFLWGKVAKDTTGTESVGWVALMYTDYETVRSQGGSGTVNNGTAIANGFITYKGYVNVRSDAGTDNQIVGALYNGTEVKIYETKFVNGLEWGRCDTGWFCLIYANITRKTNTTNTSDVGYISYTFTGKLLAQNVYDAPDGDRINSRQIIDTDVTVTNLTNVNGITWGKIAEGWVKISDQQGVALDVKLDIAKYTVSSELTVRTEHNASSARVDTLTKGLEFNVNQSKQVVVIGETIWGYADKVGESTLTYSGWVNLANKYVTRGDLPTVPANSDNNVSGKIGTIIGADSVRVRSTGSLSGKVVGSIKLGTTVNILGEKNGWYKIDYSTGNDSDSWVYGQYVEVKDGTVESGSASTNGTGVGIIANTYGGVNVRASAGMNGALKGKILPGTQVNILETMTVGATQWGRVEQGWICMDYVQIISDLPQDVLDALLGSGSTGGSGSGSSTTTGAEVAIYTGVIADVGYPVNIRKETSLDSDVVRTLNAGDNVTVHEILEVVTVTESDPEEKGNSTSTTTTKTTNYWARVNDGYIINPDIHVILDTLDEAVYTITGSDTLNVRDVAGTDGSNILHRLEKGAQVKVTKLTIIKGNVWGYIEVDPTDAEKTYDEEGNVISSVDAWAGEGWISLAYTTKGAVSVNTGNTGNSGNTGSGDSSAATTPAETKPIGSTGNTGDGGFVSNAGGYKYTGKVINTDSLNVRNTASTGSGVATKLKRGASLVIYETCIAEGFAWGRCDAGWVYLYYVDMTPVNGAVDARVVYNDNTIIYTDKDGSATAGTYCKMAVIDIYEVVGNMARTDLGWVCTDNLL